MSTVYTKQGKIEKKLLLLFNRKLHYVNRTALHGAVLSENAVDLVESLCCAGANVSLPDSKGRTPLMYVATHVKHRRTISRLLSQYSYYSSSCSSS